MRAKELRTFRKQLAEAKGKPVTQADLAALFDVATNTVARWERDELGMHPSKAKEVRAIAAAELAKARRK